MRATVSLISAGTEMLIYRGEASPDDPLPPYSEGSLSFPIKYGYQCVGRVEQAGERSGFAIGDRVFARHPHQEVFTVGVEQAAAVRLPDSLGDDAAAFLNLTKVALTALLEVPVRLGDVAVVYGLGIIGLQLTRLAGMTAGRLIAVDPIPRRRRLAIDYGAHVAVPPEEARAAVEELSSGRGADVSFDASGAPLALQSAIDATGDNGSIVVLSYYGQRAVGLRLAPEFHFRRQRIVSCQAAPIPAALQPRWDAARRSQLVLELLERLGVDDLISARVPFAEADRAYRLLDERPDHMLGVLLEYGGHSPTRASV